MILALLYKRRSVLGILRVYSDRVESSKPKPGPKGIGTRDGIIALNGVIFAHLQRAAVLRNNNYFQGCIFLSYLTV
jgi:hypothetical protein